MILYFHKKTIRYYDYDSFLESVTGLAWSNNENGDHATGFEQGDYATLKADKLAVLERHPEAKIEIREGKPITSKCNLNPHGLM